MSHQVRTQGDPSPIRINQIGYLPNSQKIGVIVVQSTNNSPLSFTIEDESTGNAVLSGQTSIYGLDRASMDFLHHADFSELKSVGTYRLSVNGGKSVPFEITYSLYPDLYHESLNYFYFHRLGVPIRGEHLIDPRYERLEALHDGDKSIPPYQNKWCSGCDNFDVFGSWADAGDFGIYAVNHAISAWTLLNLLEAFGGRGFGSKGTAFGDEELNLPESGNGVSDLLDEVDYGSTFMKGMLPSDGGLASHKVHNHQWSGFGTLDAKTENSQPRSAMGSSTAATYAVARTNAHLARMWQKHKDGHTKSSHIATLWNAAKDAFDRARGTNKPYNSGEASPGPAIGGGDYDDYNLSDDFYAASVEMYLTARELENENVVEFYQKEMMGSQHYLEMRHFDWATVVGAGTLSLLAAVMADQEDDVIPLSDQGLMEQNVVNFAKSIHDLINQPNSNGYPSNIHSGSYPWGSNSFLMNRAVVLAYAYEITGDLKYQQDILRTMDYMMGVNAMRLSYVTGYGEFSESDTHDRWAWSVGQSSFWPKGWLSGGPNNELINDNATPKNTPPAKAYAPPNTAPGAWGSKANAINWNAPLAWVAWYIDHKIVPNFAGCPTNCAPKANSQTLPSSVPSSSEKTDCYQVP